EHLPYGLPVHAGRFHGHVRTAMGREPISEGKQLRRGGGKCPHVIGHRSADGEASARHDRLLMHIESGALRVHDVHDHPLEEVASAWSPRQRSLEGALSGASPVAAVRGARGAPGPTTIRALRTIARPTSVPTPGGNSIA